MRLASGPTMHLQQTKRSSLETGGPQYYFHDLSRPVRSFLRQEGSVRVALVTPYGATPSDFLAVSTDHKLDSKLRPVPGRVGHDRIQQGRAQESIGESIRRWYDLPKGSFETIEIDVEVRDDAFYIVPLRYKFPGRPEREISRCDRPLTFTRHYISPFWRQQVSASHRKAAHLTNWVFREICRVMQDHRPASRLAHVQEPDLLRASGPLAHLGVRLGGYVGRGYDCLSGFQFLDFPEYTVPVEIKKHSRNFSYQQRRYEPTQLSRAVILCALHDHKTLGPNIDVIELDALCHDGPKLLTA